MTQVTIDLDPATAAKLKLLLKAGTLEGAVKKAVDVTLEVGAIKTPEYGRFDAGWFYDRSVGNIFRAARGGPIVG